MNRRIVLIALVAAGSFTAGQLAQFPAARAAEPTTGDLLLQIQNLQRKVATIEQTTTVPLTAEQRITGLESQLAAIGQVLQIQPSGLTLKSAGSVSIEAGSTLVLAGKGTTTVSGSFVRLNGGNKAVSHANGTSPTVTVP